MNEIFFVMLGGTITMDADPAGFKPVYDARHLLCAAYIQKSNLPSSERAAYYKKLTSLKNNRYSNDEITKYIDAILNNFGVKNIQQLMRDNNLSPNIITPLKPLSKTPNTHVSKDGLLDSINFDFSIHFEKIKQTLANLFAKRNQTAIVFGGTDTLEFYAPALDVELHKVGLLTSNNLTFLSSMTTFEANPAHVAKLINGALALAKDKSTPYHFGAYLLSPNINHAGKTIGATLHQLSKHITKISSKLTNAFRSDEGIMHQITFVMSDITQSFTRHKVNKALTLAQPKISYGKKKAIAPPLITGNSPKVIISFLAKFLEDANNGKKHFDIVPIENNTSLLSPTQSAKITSYIQALALKNIQVVFIKDKKPTSQHATTFTPSEIKTLKPIMLEAELLKQAGTLFLEGPTSSLYIALRQGMIAVPSIHKDTLQKQAQALPATCSSNNKTDEPIKIKYVPDQTVFKPMLTLASSISNHIVIEALPGQIIPDYYQSLITDLLNNDVKISVGFKYSGTHYTEAGHTFTEGESDSHGYAASKWLKEAGVETCGSTPPSKIGCTHNHTT